MNTEIKAGRTPEGDLVTVSIELRTKIDEGHFLTVEHEAPPARWQELSIQGNCYQAGKRPTERSLISCGQNVDDLRRVVPSEQWSANELALLAKLWDRWHLNGMQAHCAHMTLPDDPSYDARQHLVCELPDQAKPYRYGHAWLIELLPADVIAHLQTFQRRLNAPGYRLND